MTLCSVVSGTHRPDAMRVAERTAVERVVLVSAVTLGYHVLLIAGARTRLSPWQQHHSNVPVPRLQLYGVTLVRRAFDCLSKVIEVTVT